MMVLFQLLLKKSKIPLTLLKILILDTFIILPNLPSFYNHFSLLLYYNTFIFISPFSFPQNKKKRQGYEMDFRGEKEGILSIPICSC